MKVIAHKVIAHVDGGSRGNPGPAAYGVLIENEEGRPLARLKGTLGRQTNNYAEYQALLAALHWARERAVDHLEVLADSELMVRQMLGDYRVRSPLLRPLYLQARALSLQLSCFRIRSVPREENRDADRLANEALDEAAKAR